MGRPLLKAGERRGSLVFIARVGGTSRRPIYRIKCDCGREYDVSGSSFTVRDGCRACSTSGAPKKYGAKSVGGDLLYSIWTGMRYRCRTVHPKNKHWNGRGIKVCKAWNESFDAFRSWALANGYQKGLSIDRKKVDLDYTPDNCEWITRSENSKRARASYSVIRIEQPVFLGGETQWL